MPDSGLSLRAGSSAISSVQHPKVSGPLVSTEIVVEQLLSPGIASGLDTQQWAMRTQAGYNLVGKLELKDKGWEVDTRLAHWPPKKGAVAVGRGQGLSQRLCALICVQCQ